MTDQKPSVGSAEPKPKLRIVATHPHGHHAEVYYGDTKMLNVTKAVITIDASGLNRAVLEVIDLDIEVAADGDHVIENLWLPPGPARMTLTHEEAVRVLDDRKRRTQPDNDVDAAPPSPTKGDTAEYRWPITDEWRTGTITNIGDTAVRLLPHGSNSMHELVQVPNTPDHLRCPKPAAADNDTMQASGSRPPTEDEIRTYFHRHPDELKKFILREQLRDSARKFSR